MSNILEGITPIFDVVVKYKIEDVAGAFGTTEEAKYLIMGDSVEDVIEKTKNHLKKISEENEYVISDIRVQKANQLWRTHHNVIGRKIEKTESLVTSTGEMGEL